MAIDNPLHLSDEDFMRAMESQDNTTSNEPKQEEESSTASIEDTQVSDTTVTDTDTTEINDDLTQDTDKETEKEPKEQSQEIDENSTTTSDTDTQTTKNTETTTVDYKAFYEAVTQDYKASGRVMPGVKDPQKLIKALQMATDYAQKTTALKPVLKRAKMLENVSDEELAEMLDFKNRNPEVIKKALKEANLNPLDLDMSHINYVPESKIITDSEYDYRTTLDEVAKDAKFEVTKHLILNGLDQASKQIALTDPLVLKALHQEVVSGRLEKIQAKAVELRTFGNLPAGTTDLSLYASIAKQMDQEESMVKQSVVSTQVASNTQQTTVTVNPDLEDKKLKASIQNKKQSKVVQKYDPTKLSDEEFMRLMSDGADFINK